ncbi:MAG: LruC domain-containing protein [Paludibacter sp.]|nr:LruC domain-containing protein [Paludibacter sp.]
MITRKIVSLPFMLVLVSIGLSFIFSGCEVDYYQEPEDNPGTGSSLFEDGVTVPAGFDWATMRTVNVTVKVDDQYNGNYYYTVELFDSNPLFDENATLLGKGVAKKDINFKTTIALAADIETVYIKQIDPTGREKVTAASFGNGADISVTFIQGKSTLKSTNVAESSLRSTNALSSSLRSVPSSVITNRQTPTPDNNDVIEITATTPNPFTLAQDKSYVIAKNTTYTGALKFPGEGNTSLYVEGIWINTLSNITLEANTDIFIQNDGVFKTNTDLAIEKGGDDGTVIAVASGGSFNEDNKNITITFSGEGQVVNGGLLNVTSITLSKDALFYNYGNATITEFTINSSGNNITNDKTLKVTTANLTNGSLTNNDSISFGSLTANGTTITNDKTLEVTTANLTNGSLTNNCHISFGSLTTSGPTFTLGEESLMSVENYLSSGGTKFYMNTKSIFEVTNEVYFNTQLNTIEGIGDGFALARLTKVTTKGKGIDYKGNVCIEYSEHTPNNQYWDSSYTLYSPAYFAKKGESDVYIPATECNGDGNIPTPGAPANPVFPIIHKGSTLTYLFEDNWPYLGDYDMNDLVLDVAPTYTTNGDNKITQLKLDVTLRAAGATKRLGVGIQLDGITPAMISRFERSNDTGINGNVFSSGDELESGQTYAVIPVFDDVHKAFGHSTPLMTNTIKGSPNNNIDTPAVSFTVEFVSPVEKGTISVDKFNVFIVNGGYKTNRQEIHLAGFQPTGKADTSKFDFADDNSDEKFYTSKNNMIWGLAIPGPAKYPVEWTSIRLAYSGLESWATSGGTSDKDWYKNFNENRVYDK